MEGIEFKEKFGTLVGNSFEQLFHQRGPNNVQGYHDWLRFA